MTWQAPAGAAPELAAFGAERLHDRVAYLATLRRDGSPRLHPVRPVVASGHLFVFMEATSPRSAIWSATRGTRCTAQPRATNPGTCGSSRSKAPLGVSTI